MAVQGPPRRGGGGGGGGGVFDNIVKQASSSSADGAPPASGVEGVKITLYKNGFTVNDGPIRDVTTPENILFLQTLDRGEVPVELAVKGRNLDVSLEDKREEEYIPPAYTAFSGGNSLGSSSSSTSSAYTFSPEMMAGADLSAVDETQPVTTLQIRTHNGKKIRIKINQSATVLELAATISRDAGASSAFVLSSGFPPADITDAMLTIKDAGLIGAAVIQKLV